MVGETLRVSLFGGAVFKFGVGARYLFLRFRVRGFGSYTGCCRFTWKVLFRYFRRLRGCALPCRGWVFLILGVLDVWA